MPDECYTIVLYVSKNEHELEWVLLNYDLDEKIIALKIIAYDEITEAWSKVFAQIENGISTIFDEFYSDELKIGTSKFHFNKFVGISQIQTVFESIIRPNESIPLNKVYTGSITFKSYFDICWDINSSYHLQYVRVNLAI